MPSKPPTRIRTRMCNERLQGGLSLDGPEKSAGAKPRPLACALGSGTAFLAVIAFFGGAHVALPCPFCALDSSPTLVEDFKQANIVLLGTLTNARLDDGTTDLVIEK